MRTILGIDPGAGGALSFYDGEELILFDMPVYEIAKGKTKRKRVDFAMLCKIIMEQKPDHAYVELVSAQFGNGAASAFSFGCAVTCVDNALIVCKVPVTYITPQTWKKTMACPADKDAARLRASQLMPNHAHNWDRKKDDGRAESALIAYYGFTR